MILDTLEAYIYPIMTHLQHFNHFLKMERKFLIPINESTEYFPTVFLIYTNDEDKHYGLYFLNEPTESLITISERQWY